MKITKTEWSSFPEAEFSRHDYPSSAGRHDFSSEHVLGYGVVYDKHIHTNSLAFEHPLELNADTKNKRNYDTDTMFKIYKIPSSVSFYIIIFNWT